MTFTSTSGMNGGGAERRTVVLLFPPAVSRGAENAPERTDRQSPTEITRNLGDAFLFLDPARARSRGLDWSNLHYLDRSYSHSLALSRNSAHHPEARTLRLPTPWMLRELFLSLSLSLSFFLSRARFPHLYYETSFVTAHSTDAGRETSRDHASQSDFPLPSRSAILYVTSHVAAVRAREFGISPARLASRDVTWDPQPRRGAN